MTGGSHGPPALGRSITLRLKGDTGGGNIHRVCAWLSQGLSSCGGEHTSIAVMTGRAFVDNVRAVGRGQVDVAVSTPASFVTVGLDGRGPYRGEVFPHLRALGVIPQDDRLVVGVHKSLGITSIAQLREARPALRIATGCDDGVDHVGVAAQEVLARSGINVEDWGGAYVRDDGPFKAIDHVRTGRANAIVHEAVMLPGWQEIGHQLNFLDLDPEVLDSLRADFDWPSADLPAYYFPGAGPIHTLDFSDFLVFTTEFLDDDIAYAMAWIMGETRGMLEAQYAHIPAERSPISYPLDPVLMGRTPIPLHPGAARYYDMLGDGQ